MATWNVSKKSHFGLNSLTSDVNEFFFSLTTIFFFFGGFVNSYRLKEVFTDQ